MTPFFNPGPEPATATPKIFLAGVGELMTEVAGEVCDGFLCHGFTTEQLPPRGHAPGARARAGPRRARRWTASRSSARRSSSPAPTRRRWRRPPTGTRQQIAFYGSTPAYRGVLELHGWGGLQDELNALSKQGKWVEMGDLIDDEILNTFAVVGEPEQIAPELHAPLRRRHPAHQLLRPVPERPRALAQVLAVDAASCHAVVSRAASGSVRRARARRRGSARGTCARCSLPDDVFGSVPGSTSITSRGGRPHTSSTRWWTASADRVERRRCAPRPRPRRSPCPCSPRRRRR